MARHLIVAQDFADYKRGDRITDPDEVASVLSAHRNHVSPIDAADPEPAAKSKAKADEA